MTEQQKALFGQQAKEVLDNPAFKTALVGIRAQIIDQWGACALREKEDQALLLQFYKVSENFESLLIGWMESGKISQRKINLDALRDESPVRKFMRKVA